MFRPWTPPLSRSARGHLSIAAFLQATNKFWWGPGFSLTLFLNSGTQTKLFLPTCGSSPISSQGCPPFPRFSLIWEFPKGDICLSCPLPHPRALCPRRSTPMNRVVTWSQISSQAGAGTLVQVDSCSPAPVALSEVDWGLQAIPCLPPSLGGIGQREDSWE